MADNDFLTGFEDSGEYEYTEKIKPKRKYNMANRRFRQLVPMTEMQRAAKERAKRDEATRPKRKYDSSKRKARAFRKSLADTQKLIEKLEEREIDKAEHTRERESHRSKGIYAKHRKPRNREGLPQRERRMRRRINRLPSNRICPDCGKLTLKSRQWAIIDCENSANGPATALANVDTDARKLRENVSGIRAICLKCYRNSRKSAF